jgi:hypothetical protein
MAQEEATGNIRDAPKQQRGNAVFPVSHKAE